MRTGKRLGMGILTVLLVAVMLTAGMCVSAKNALPDGFVIVDEEGVSVSTEDGKYHVLLTDMLPGEVYTKDIMLHNLEEGSKFQLYMRMYPESQTGNINLFELATLTLSLDGKQFYSGSPNGLGNIDMDKKAVDLGMFESGQPKKLHMTVSIPGEEVKSGDEGQVEFWWQFDAVKEATPPKTGLLMNYVLWIVVVSVGVALLVALGVYVFYLKKREKREGKENAACG